MRVTIEHNQRTEGLLFKTTYYGVRCTVVFTEEEKQIIKKNKLGDYIFMQRTGGTKKMREHHRDFPGHQDIKVKDLLKADGVGYTLETPLDAKAYEQDLREHFKKLKDVIEGNQQVEKQSDTFEL